MDPISLIKVPAPLMQAALANLDDVAPNAFGLGRAAEYATAEEVVKSVILSAVAHLNDDETQRAIGEHITELLPTEPWVRRNRLGQVVDAFAYQLGVTR